MSEAPLTLRSMGDVIRLEEFRRRQEPSEVHPAFQEASTVPPAEVERLEAAVSRLQRLVERALEKSGRLDDKLETELLAIMGELAVGLVSEAAARAERLTTTLKEEA